MKKKTIILKSMACLLTVTLCVLSFAACGKLEIKKVGSFGNGHF